ncbi:hypothetical protein FACS1894195_3090 [Bacteroidia bacterium]|nr:hypothetical protein FACS1894195_3090 [Bacteroidia bacterium]
MRSIFKLAFLMVAVVACSSGKPALNKAEFTQLLIDLHTLDATVTTIGYEIPNKDKKVYTYYNWIYEKYGITNAEFSTCVEYYTSQTAVYVEIYEAVIDSLNRQLTDYNQLLAGLKSADSLNYFPVLDTLHSDTLIFNKANPSRVYEIDSLLPGNYQFGLTFKFDTVNKNQLYKVVSMFISTDSIDTLRVKDITLLSDTVSRNYSWTQYIDSTYNRLTISMLEKEETPKQKQKTKPTSKSKDVYRGRATAVYLYKPYTPKRREKQLINSLQTAKRQNIKKRI